MLEGKHHRSVFHFLDNIANWGFIPCSENEQIRFLTGKKSEIKTFHEEVAYL